MSITITSTNVFRGQDQLGALIKCLAAQTCQDFQWVLVDAFYADNAKLVADMCAARGFKDVVHVPYRGNTRVAATYHWTTYNDALLLARYSTILRVGVFRYIHPSVVGLAADLATQQTWVSLRQQDVDRFEDISDAALIDKYGLEVATRTNRDRMSSHCGMFSQSKQTLMDMNGNNEAFAVHHAEDSEYNSRFAQLGRTSVVSLEKAMLRVYHSKCRTLTYLPKVPCEKADNPACIYHAANNHELKKYAHPDTEWRDHQGFPWARCRTCNAVANGYCDEYYRYLATDPRGFRAPVGVFGVVGRNLAAVADDLAKLDSLQSKVELLAESHEHPKYLGG